MNVSVLGPLEASVDGRPVALGAGKPRALLAILALHAGEPVSTERLIDGLWGERPPASAANSVQVYVSKLRLLLGDGGRRGEQLLVTQAPGYMLKVPALSDTLPVTLWFLDRGKLLNERRVRRHGAVR